MIPVLEAAPRPGRSARLVSGPIPRDAEREGLADGDSIEIRGDRASVRATLRVTATMHRGVVALPGKWWSVHGETAAVANLLTPAAWAPHGQRGCNDVYVEVRPVASTSGEPIAERLTIPVA